MTVRIEGAVARLEGVCGVRDAEPLFAACAAGRVTEADVTACAGMHAAVAQTLLRFSLVVVGEPQDPFIRDFVTPALKRRRAPAR